MVKRKLPIGIQDFVSIREDDYLYIDKTELIYRLDLNAETYTSIDEYDKPLLSTIGNPQLHEESKQYLKPFFRVLKSADAHLKFAFITGVTKFGQVSVFSDFNQLIDLSMHKEYISLCGITEEELLDVFRSEIDGIELPASAFADYRVDPDRPVPVIYQSGYLTIKSYNKRHGGGGIGVD